MLSDNNANKSISYRVLEADVAVIYVDCLVGGRGFPGPFRTTNQGEEEEEEILFCVTNKHKPINIVTY